MCRVLLVLLSPWPFGGHLHYNFTAMKCDLLQDFLSASPSRLTPLSSSIELNGRNTLCSLSVPCHYVALSPCPMDNRHFTPLAHQHTFLFSLNSLPSTPTITERLIETGARLFQAIYCGVRAKIGHFTCTRRCSDLCPTIPPSLPRIEPIPLLKSLDVYALHLSKPLPYRRQIIS